MRSLGFKAALVLAAIWLVAGGIIYWARSAKTTAESLATYLETHPLAGEGAEREKGLQADDGRLQQDDARENGSLPAD